MRTSFHRQAGVSLIEVLVTMLILAFGLLGLAGLHSRAQLAELESYQRAQAIVLLEDMMQRMNANSDQMAAYVTGNAPLGTGDAQPATCNGVAVGALRDRCEWSNALKGAAEVTSGATRIGAMESARGCIDEIQAPNPATGVCLPGIYRVTIVWQGIHLTAAPPAALACGQNLYGDEKLRRAISGQVQVAVRSCL